MTSRLFTTLALAVICASCGPDAAPPIGRATPPKAIRVTRPESAILIVVDALRADALDVASITPTFASIAAGGSVFRAVTPAASCKASVASILTSLDPGRHGAIEDARSLGAALWTLPEVLRCEGFATASFAANGYISDRFGFDQGWDHQVNYIREHRASTADAVLGDASTWIAEHRDERFFVYVHLIDPHTPYDPPAPFAPPDQADMPRPRSTAELMEGLRSGERTASAAEQQWLRALYRGEVRFVDAQLGAFLARLDALGLGDTTLVVVTADHGEALGEDGVYGHWNDAPEATSVPLLFRGPGRPIAGGEVVTTRDLAPTILEALELEIPVRFEGRSFGPRRLAAREGPRAEYVPTGIVIDRETCLQIRNGYAGPDLDCNDYPPSEETVGPSAPCVSPAAR